MEVFYQWLYTKFDVQAYLGRYEERSYVDHAYLELITNGALAKREELDVKITEYLEERSLEEISKIEYSILLVSVYELMFVYDVPYRVVINEGINMAKIYGALDSHKFVNSVLDRIAKDVRGLECQD